ncbi:MAG TPA: methylated-DNA--[protein]-cysteine S-methyltransferase [Parvularculaceae bacterium]|nr:methylated-DNA--[protein]-cysteine S-methyltransferase [Parvularculaceae bacterium]
MTANVIIHDSPVGPLTLKSNGECLISIWFEKDKRDASRPDAAGARDKILDQTRRELDQYFAGARKAFDVPFAPNEGTEFQRKVWKALTRIPFGKTVSYGFIAKQIGLPKAVRAVGAANGANPIPIIVPCHRVIGADGSLTGFGGGLDRKRYLLGLEREEAPLL